MKKFLFILTAILSFSAMANTSLVCNDQNSHSVYKLEISSDSGKMVFSPILRDSSTLSSSVATLRYNEGESGSAISIFEGKNADKNTIVVEVKNNELVPGQIAEVNVYFSKSSEKLDQNTLFLCDVNVAK